MDDCHPRERTLDTSRIQSYGQLSAFTLYKMRSFKGRTADVDEPPLDKAPARDTSTVEGVAQYLYLSITDIPHRIFPVVLVLLPFISVVGLVGIVRNMAERHLAKFTPLHFRRGSAAGSVPWYTNPTQLDPTDLTDLPFTLTTRRWRTEYINPFRPQIFLLSFISLIHQILPLPPFPFSFPLHHHLTALPPPSHVDRRHFM